MEFKKLMGAALMLGAMTFGVTTTNAQQVYYDNEFKTHYGASTATGCFVCHDGKKGSFRPYGVAVNAARMNAANRSIGIAIANVDGLTNPDTTNTWAVDIAAGSLPDTEVTSGSNAASGGCISMETSTPLMMFIAMLSLGFFVRRKK